MGIDKKLQKANHLQNEDYFWISILIQTNSAIRKLFYKVDQLLTQIQINDNKSYIDNIKAVKQITDNVKASDVKDTDCIANHINISNYTRIEAVDECYDFISSKLPPKIVLGKIAIIVEGIGVIYEKNLSN